MGEYAKIKKTGTEVKIGTCESMYYIRYHDRDKVDYNFEKGRYYFRLPFPDEDTIKIGMYEQFDRTLYCGFFNLVDIEKDAGIVQLYNKDCGILVNLPCYHGVCLPDISSVENAKVFWNGKKNPLELSSIKYEHGKITKPVFTCKCCRKSWSIDWYDVMQDKDIQLPEWLTKAFMEDIEKSIKENGLI